MRYFRTFAIALIHGNTAPIQAAYSGQLRTVFERKPRGQETPEARRSTSVTCQREERGQKMRLRMVRLVKKSFVTERGLP